MSESFKIETGWLIEFDSNGFPSWFKGFDDFRHSDFVTDSLGAIRFARKEDAEQLIANSDLKHAKYNVTVTEHQWG